MLISLYIHVLAVNKDIVESRVHDLNLRNLIMFVIVLSQTVALSFLSKRVLNISLIYFC